MLRVPCLARPCRALPSLALRKVEPFPFMLRVPCPALRKFEPFPFMLRNPCLALPCHSVPGRALPSLAARNIEPFPFMLRNPRLAKPCPAAPRRAVRKISYPLPASALAFGASELGPALHPAFALASRATPPQDLALPWRGGLWCASLLIEEYQTGGKSQYESIKKVGQKKDLPSHGYTSIRCP